jgi:predicted negative regulator of RcsB-dependent stress response
MKQVLKEWFANNSDWFIKVVILTLAAAIIAEIIFD